MKKLKKNKGITLIALIVTIIVLLILAGVSITMLLGDNGIINQTQKAKEETIIASEKEVINLSYINCQQENKYDNEINEKDLQEEIKNYGYLTEVNKRGKNFIIVFNETQNKYTLLSDGSIKLGEIEEAIQYNIIINEYEGGSLTLSKNSGTEGETITLKVSTNTGYRLSNIEVKDENNELIEPTMLDDTTYTFVMPKSNVYITATFQSILPPSQKIYDIDVVYKNDSGTITVKPSKAKGGEIVSITIIPDQGYQLDLLNILNQKNEKIDVLQESKDSYTFKMPNEAVTIEVSFKLT